MVAGEVRSLAQQSAGSAGQIRRLIGESSAQVDTSVTMMREAEAGMRSISQEIDTVSGTMGAIAGATREQSLNLAEISTTLKRLDEITQQNAKMVDEAGQSARRLEGWANDLASALGSFRLTQGVGSEAIALVRKACSLRGRSASREDFLRRVTDASEGLADRDMYVFALDDDGRYLAFAGNAAKVGTRVHDIPGVDGAGLLRSIRDSACDEGAWVEYDIVNPTSGALQTKMSFVVALEDLYLGCGVYKNLA